MRFSARAGSMNVLRWRGVTVLASTIIVEATHIIHVVLDECVMLLLPIFFASGASRPRLQLGKQRNRFTLLYFGWMRMLLFFIFYNPRLRGDASWNKGFLCMHVLYVQCVSCLGCYLAWGLCGGGGACSLFLIYVCLYV
jgi:hypothetical protein